MSNFNVASQVSGLEAEHRDAVRRAREMDLRCWKCTAWNRPTAILVRLGDDGIACCDECGEAWRVVDA